MPNFSKSANEPIDLSNNVVQSQTQINRDFDLRLQDIESYLEQNTATLHSMMALLKQMGEATHELDKRLTNDGYHNADAHNDLHRRLLVLERTKQ